MAMTNLNLRPNRGIVQSGFTMIEVLITFIILVVGLLGLIGLQARTQQAELESYQRGQALVLLQDIVDRMNANRLESKSLVYVTGTTTPLGGGGALTNCPATGAARDKCEWGNLLNGAAEVATGGTCDVSSGAKCVGAMLGARGCIVYDATTELSDGTGAVIAGTGIHTITVAWQGVSKGSTALASNLCGKNQFPDETQRRLATATMRIGALKAK
jgi:type IV pilus assembly protein PilV